MQISVIPRFGGGAAKENPHTLQKKATKRATSKVMKETTGKTRPDLTLETSILASTKSAYVLGVAEGLDVTLDDSASIC